MPTQKLLFGTHNIFQYVNGFPGVYFWKDLFFLKYNKRPNTVKIDYNEQGYNEISFITNNILVPFGLVIQNHIACFTVITNNGYNEHIHLVMASSL